MFLRGDGGEASAWERERKRDAEESEESLP